MAINLGVSSDSSNAVKIEGDLGDIQVTDVSDSEDTGEEIIGGLDKNSRTINPVSDLSQSLVQRSTVPVFGNISITESENVQFGNNTYFNGPVTIKQVVHNKSGIENGSYTKSDEEETKSNIHSQKTNLNNYPLKKHEILVWHKLTFSAVCVTIIGGIIAIVLVLPGRGDSQNGNTPSHETDNTNSSVVGFCHENVEVTIISIIIMLLTLLSVLYSLLTRDFGPAMTRVHDNCKDKKYTQFEKAETEALLISAEYLRVVSRDDWLAQPVEAALDPLRLPAPWVVITHTATDSCSSQSQCVLRVRVIQSFHIESRGWSDIGYNFLVGGDGSVYLGRGWDSVGAHTQGYNKYSIGIAFIGTFNNYKPPKRQLEACQKLIKLGVKLGKIRADYKLLGHRQLMSTLSPGDQLFDIIKTWPHFATNYTDIKELLPDY